MNFLKMKLIKIKCEICNTVFQKLEWDKDLNLCVKCQNKKDGIIPKEEEK